MHHHHVKSLEEYEKKIRRGTADGTMQRTLETFNSHDTNDVLDDGILKYRDARVATLIPHGGGIETLFHSKRVDYICLFNALTQNLMPTILNLTVPNYFVDKTENFLTCLNLSFYLKGRIFTDDDAEFFTKLALESIVKSLSSTSIAEIFLLIDEMPKILAMPYPTVEKIREALLDIIPQVMMIYRMNNHWQGWVELDHELKMLKSFGEVKKIR